MSFGDLWDMANMFLEDNEDKDNGDTYFNDKNEQYISYWRRMDIASKVLLRDKRHEEATQLAVAFFTNFEDLEKLEELTLKAEKLITRPLDP